MHIWKLNRNPESGSIEVCLQTGGSRDPRTGRAAGLIALFSPQVEHCHGECISDTQVCGARFCDPSGRSFAVTGYDLAEIMRFSSV